MHFNTMCLLPGISLNRSFCTVALPIYVICVCDSDKPDSSKGMKYHIYYYIFKNIKLNILQKLPGGIFDTVSFTVVLTVLSYRMR